MIKLKKKKNTGDSDGATKAKPNPLYILNSGRIGQIQNTAFSLWINILSYKEN